MATVVLVDAIKVFVTVVDSFEPGLIADSMPVAEIVLDVGSTKVLSLLLAFTVTVEVISKAVQTSLVQRTVVKTVSKSSTVWSALATPVGMVVCSWSFTDWSQVVV